MQYTAVTELKDPKITIICVTFNAGKTLPHLLQSISDHRTADTEFIVIDGASTDNTLQIVQQNSHLINFWLSEPDQGIYDAMNKAVTYAKGKWVMFLGADDVLAEGYRDMVTQATDAHAVYYGNVLFYGKLFTKVYDDYFLTKLNICHQGILYPKAVFDKYEYDTQYKLYADYHLNLRLWKDPEFTFVHRNYLVAGFAEGGYSMQAKDELFEQHRDYLFKKYLKRSSYYRYLNRKFGFLIMLKRMLFNE